MVDGAKRNKVPPPILDDGYEETVAPPAPVDRGPEIVASSLAPQLGSDSTALSSGKVDMRRFSVIEERDLPFLIYASIRAKKSRVWARLYDEFLNLRVSVGGRGRKDIIRMEGVSKAGLPDETARIEAHKPGFFERNIFNRNWRRKVQEEML